jgi:hypothetical protein
MTFDIAEGGQYSSIDYRFDLMNILDFNFVGWALPTNILSIEFNRCLNVI